MTWLPYGFLAAVVITLVAVHRPHGRLFALLFMRRGLTIGPWVWGRNHSKGYPLRPKRVGAGWVVPLKPDGELHAVLDHDFKIDPAATKLIWHYRADIAHAAPVERIDRPALVSLVLQRKGDDWAGKGSKQFYRLYSPAFPLETGEHVREIPLVGWTGVWGLPGDVHPVLAELSNVAVAFGHSAGRMHGVSGSGSFTQIGLRAA